MKIAVYAITKNRETTVERWLRSTDDADARFVLDWGSEDQTVALLESSGVHVEKFASPTWDAAQARNEILARIPEDFDVCISLDLEEFLTPTWRSELEKIWSPETTRLAYLRITDHSGDNDQPNRMKVQDRIHARQGYSWQYATDEVLVPDTRIPEKVIRAERLQVRHLAIEDFRQLSQERAAHLSHVRDSIRRFPEESRYLLALGRELSAQNKLGEARSALEAYLRSDGSYDSPAGRAAAYRELAECYSAQRENPDLIVQALYRSALENPGDRDSWGYLAFTLAKYENWPGCHAALQNAFQSAAPPVDQLIEPAFIDGGLEALQRLSTRQLGL